MAISQVVHRHISERADRINPDASKLTHHPFSIDLSSYSTTNSTAGDCWGPYCAPDGAEIVCHCNRLNWQDRTFSSVICARSTRTGRGRGLVLSPLSRDDCDIFPKSSLGQIKVRSGSKGGEPTTHTSSTISRSAVPQYSAELRRMSTSKLAKQTTHSSKAGTIDNSPDAKQSRMRSSC
jgi:hypothetical protein